MMKRPLVRVALSFGAGLLLGRHLPLLLTPLFAAAFVLTLAAFVRPRWRPWLLPLLLLLAGWINLTRCTSVLSPHDLRRLLNDEPRIVSLRGQLAETPTQRVYERDEQPTYRTVVRLDVEAIELGSGWRPAHGRVAVNTSGILDTNFFVGRQAEVNGVIRPPAGPVAPGLFDYRAHLRNEGIYFALGVESAAAWQLLDRGSPPARPISDSFLGWAQKTLARGLPQQDESLELVWAMVLGWQTALTNEVSAPFMRSGTMHVFAISGLHIALIAGVLVSLTRILRIPRGVCGLLVIPLIWFYTAATGWQPSAIRSTIMMTIIIAGWALKRPCDLLNSLAGAAFIILVWDPLQLFQASFQLSFFVVLSIALFMTPIEKWLSLLWRPDPLLPEELRPRWQRWLGRPLRWLAASLATSLAAWLGSLPLTAWYFHIFNPISLLANLVIVPLSSLALMSGLGSLFCGDWLPWPGELFNHAAWFWMTAMIAASEGAADMRFGWWYVASPDLSFFLFYYMTLIAGLTGWFVRPKLRFWAASSVFVLGAIWGVRSWQSGRETTLTVLPLSGGHAIFLNQPARAHDWLVDTGNASAAEFVTIPFLRGQGVNRLAHVALTQGDVHQIGGGELVTTEFPPGEIVTSPVPARSPYYRKFTADLATSHRRWVKISRGDRLGPWRVLHPAGTDRFAQADDNALVLTADFVGARVLLLSELGRAGQEALLRRETDLRADIVVAGLPTKDEPLGEALLDAIQPKLIVLADSEFPAQRRAPARLKERLGQRGVPVVYTRESAAVVLQFTKDGWQMTPMNPANAKPPNKVNERESEGE